MTTGNETGSREAETTGLDERIATGYQVSVLVPTFNREKYLGECLDSLLAQTMPALEIIVIDDGSDDGTGELVKAYGQKIRYVRKENGGKPMAVNLGLSLAKGDLIWIFDDDDVALPTAIENRVKVLEQHPEAGFVFSPHYYGTDDQDGRILRGRLHEVPDCGPDRFFFELMNGCFFHLATALVRAEAYRTVGGFDKELLSSEDYDMQLRLTRAFPVAYCSEPSFIFRQHSGPRGAKTIRYSGDQRSKVFRRFDQRVGQKLRGSLLLADYLVPRREHVSDPSQTKAALLGRMQVMASKGCLQEMIEDLRLVQEHGGLDAHSRRLISTAVCTGYAPDAIENDWIGFSALLFGIPDFQGKRIILRTIAHGLFRLAKGYPAPASVRWLRLKQAGYLALCSLGLMGKSR